MTRPIAVADVETTRIMAGSVPRTLFWGVALEDGSYQRFPTSQALWKWLSGQELLIYVHHDFDLLQLLSERCPLRVGRTRSGRLLSAFGPDGVEWRNSHALFPSSLAEILEAAGYVKPELDDLDARNRADTVDALQAFRQLSDAFQDAFGVRALGGKHLTAASLAFAAAEKVAGPLPVHLQDRETYRGGRVEAFRVGRCGRADAWDIASSYPAAFTECPERDTLIVADVETTGDGPQPFFWLRENEERRGKLLFPRGRFRTAFWASHYERYYRPHGGIRAVRVVRAVPTDLAWLRELGPFMRDAYTARASAKARGDGVSAYALKIALNSVYGRLGMNAVREMAFQGPKVASGDRVRYFRLPGSREFLSFKSVFTKPKANYLYASWVTDNARARLYDALRRTATPLYCDTDSVFCATGERPEGVTLGNRLGEWQRAGEGRELTVIGAKDYVYGDEIARKGGESYTRWTLKTLLAGKPAALVTRQRRTSYDKRTVLASGETRPLVVWEW